MPDLSRGECTSGREPISLWTSSAPSQRWRAIQLCKVCKVLDECRRWTLEEMPLSYGIGTVISAGLTDGQIYKARMGYPVDLTPLTFKQVKRYSTQGNAIARAKEERRRQQRSA